MKNPPGRAVVSASRPAHTKTPEFTFEREDWTLFRSLSGERHKPVANYVPHDWQDWLRCRRVELNAMTTPQFIAWLDSKIAAFGNGKLVPPAAVLIEGLSGLLDDRLHRQITEEILDR